MTCACLSNQKKLYISIQTAVIAFLIFNPVLFKVVRSVLGGWISSADGCPSMAGLFVHALVFTGVLYLLMKPSFNKKGGGGDDSKNQRQSVSGLPLV
jgi:hypothetical protein